MTHRLNELINYEAVYRRALATPGLKCSPDLNVAPNMYLNVART